MFDKQHGQEVTAPDLQCSGPGFKSCPDRWLDFFKLTHQIDHQLLLKKSLDKKKLFHLGQPLQVCFRTQQNNTVKNCVRKGTSADLTLLTIGTQ